MTTLMDRLPGGARNIHLWLPSYLKFRRERQTAPPARVWLTIADHYEPYWQRPSDAQAQERVAQWRQRWPEIAKRHHDSAGRPPRYCFFYPEEEYRAALMDQLAEMTRAGIADVEIHIHHDGETEQVFVDRMSRFRDTLHQQHGLLRKQDGKVVFGFIHGNWALDNSLPDGSLCGLNNELLLLKDLGCYADFTLPSAPSAAQTNVINTIYWATDDPRKPRSHDTGVALVPGDPVTGDLLMIPGPLGLKWGWKGPLPVPRVENGELAAYHRPNLQRARLWLECAPRLGDDVFIKLFSHGTQERNMAVLLDTDLDQIFQDLERLCRENGSRFYFATAWEMYRAVDAVRRKSDPVQEVCQ